MRRAALLLAAGAALAGTPAQAQTRDGRALYLEACAACHGEDARGSGDRGPGLIGVGARSADFYLSTGRMPLDQPDDEPVRAPPAYSAAARRALTDFVGSLGGPGIPAVDPASGSLREGKELFTDHCAGCHQVVARGGIVAPSGIAPPLQQADAKTVVEAIRVGPYTMPAFSRREIDERQAASIARYVLSTRHPVDRGGWGIGNIGPVPEGMVAWLLAGTALLIVTRALGKRFPG